MGNIQQLLFFKNEANTTLQLFHNFICFYIFTVTYFCSNISIFTEYGWVMYVLILLNIVCIVRKCLESK